MTFSNWKTLTNTLDKSSDVTGIKQNLITYVIKQTIMSYTTMLYMNSKWLEQMQGGQRTSQSRDFKQ